MIKLQLHDMRTYTALPLSQCCYLVHRLDLERELDDRDPPGKVVRATLSNLEFELRCAGQEYERWSTKN